MEVFSPDANQEMAELEFFVLIQNRGGNEVTMNDQNSGSSFDSFLQEESILEDATEVAVERIVDWLGAKASNDSRSATD